MNYSIATKKQMADCWLPFRFVGNCLQCPAFATCKHEYKRIPEEARESLFLALGLSEVKDDIGAKIRALADSAGIDWNGFRRAVGSERQKRKS